MPGDRSSLNTWPVGIHSISLVDCITEIEVNLEVLEVINESSISSACSAFLLFLGSFFAYGGVYLLVYWFFFLL